MGTRAYFSEVLPARPRTLEAVAPRRPARVSALAIRCVARLRAPRRSARRSARERRRRRRRAAPRRPRPRAREQRADRLGIGSRSKKKGGHNDLVDIVVAAPRAPGPRTAGETNSSAYSCPATGPASGRSNQHAGGSAQKRPSPELTSPTSGSYAPTILPEIGTPLGRGDGQWSDEVVGRGVAPTMITRIVHTQRWLSPAIALPAWPPITTQTHTGK